LRLKAGRASDGLRALGAGFELEAYLAAGVSYQKGPKAPPGLIGDESWKQIGTPPSEQLDHLFRRDLLLQNDLSRAEVAGFCAANGVFADVGQPLQIDAGMTFRTIA
jgi:hypothetical protein